MIKKTKFETSQSYNKRQWFVKNYLVYNPQTKEDEAIRLSKIWINMINIGCRYPTAVETDIKKFLETYPYKPTNLIVTNNK